MLERVIIVHGDRGEEADGIRDHSARMAAVLSRHPLRVAELRVRPATAPGGRPGGSVAIWRRLRGLGSSATVILQYSPFCYARRGFAPWLPAYLLALRALADRPTIALMVHEPYVPMSSWRWALMGLWQRAQLGALRLAADVVFTSIEPWAREFRAQAPRRPVHHLPVGSNFPDGRGERERRRRELGLDPGALLLSCLGRDHPSWLGGYVSGAVNALAARGARPTLLNMGAEAPALPDLDPAVTVHRPGYLDAGSFASMLAASDLFLAPLIDGVSTRRGSVMAALQHELPVVGTAGPLTDPVLREAAPALRLTEVGDRERFSRAAAELAGDPAARAAAGTAAGELYRREFDWEVTARKLLAALPER